MVVLGLSILSLMKSLTGCKTSAEYNDFLRSNNERAAYAVQTKENCLVSKSHNFKNIKIKYFDLDISNTNCSVLLGPQSSNELFLYIASEENYAFSDELSLFYRQMRKRDEKILFIYLLHQNEQKTESIDYINEVMKIAYTELNNEKYPIICVYIVENALKYFEKLNKTAPPPFDI